jgi:hypothetical protein
MSIFFVEAKSADIFKSSGNHSHRRHGLFGDIGSYFALFSSSQFCARAHCHRQ